MELLPPLGARGALLDALALLIARSGFETFVRAPLLFPEPTYFPEPWEPSERGVRLLSLRLLAYAGLEELDARVELFTNAPQHASLPVGHHRYEGAAAWFAGIEGATCLFGADTRQLNDDDSIVGVMCHEVAHAYRAFHELESTTRQIDEEHTDVTTIYLGFGLLTLNTTYRFRTRGALVGGMATSGWSLSQSGYLPTEAMAYLLAAQAVARGLDAKARRRIAEALGANQRASFEAGCEELGHDVDALRARLGVPPIDLWPEEEPFALPALPEDAYFEPGDEPAESQRPFNEGASVFRVEESNASPYVLGGMTLGSLALSIAGHMLAWRSPGGTLAGAAVGIAIGVAFGARRSRFSCADPRCGATHASGGLERCPRCGGVIRGTLYSAKDRLEAEEALDARGGLDDLKRRRDAREKRSNRRATALIGVIVALLGWGALHVIVPRRTTIQALRGDADAIGSYVRITGDVIEPLDGDGMQNPDTHVVLTPFLLDDGTEKIHVWCDRAAIAAPIAKGARVRVTGQLEQVRVDGQGHLRFIAEAVD